MVGERGKQMRYNLGVLGLQQDTGGAEDGCYTAGRCSASLGRQMSRAAAVSNVAGTEC